MQQFTECADVPRHVTDQLLPAVVAQMGIAMGAAEIEFGALGPRQWADCGDRIMLRAKHPKGGFVAICGLKAGDCK